MYKRKSNPSGDNNPIKKKTTESKAEREPWKLVFQDARQAFSDNKFKEAVALFTRALTLNPNQITLLDCRAACYEKLNEMNFAIRDAALIIETAPTDSRGYLRAGKLLSLQKKYNKAISLYSSAIKKVDTTDTRYPMLTTMKQAAEKLARPPHKLDPITVLPYDVTSLVFSYLSFDRRVQCTGVSQKWRSFALNWSGMWRDLEFGNRKVPQATIKRYLKYTQGRHARSFSIHHANTSAMKKILQSLIDENCQYIETLDFKGCDIPIDIFARMLRLVGKHVKHLRLDDGCLTMDQIIQAIITQCPVLTHLSALRVRDVKEVYNDHQNKLTHLRTDSAELARLSTNLKLLDLVSLPVEFAQFYDKIVNTHKQLEIFHFTHQSREKTLWLSPHNITTNDADNNRKGVKTFGLYEDHSFGDRHIASFLIENPDLEELIVKDCYVSIGQGLSNHITQHGLPRLTTLNLPRCVGLTEQGLHEIISSCPSLEHVYLSMVANLTDNTLTDFATCTKKLKTLDISDCNQVTGVGLSTLVRAHAIHLEKLVLNNCQRIGPDAVTWATNQLGRVVVECKYRTK